MAWSIVGVGSVVEVTAQSHALTEPAGVASGDLLIACISSRIASTSSVALPSGGEWTRVGEQKANNTVTTSSALPSAMMAWAIRGASAPNLTFIHPTAPSVAIGRIVAYRGNLSASPLDVSTAATTGTGTTAVSVAGLTTTVADDLIVAMAAGGQEANWSSFNATTPAGASGATNTATAPTTTWIERADSVTTTGADTSLGIFDALKTAAGATGNLTVTASVSAGHSVIAGAFKILPPSTADAWDVNDKSSNITLSNSDKTATTTSASAGGIRSTTKQTSGTAEKYYAEFLVGSTRPTLVGITPQLPQSVNSDVGSFNVALSDGTIALNASTVLAVIGAFASGDVACVAWDAGARLVWFRRNGGSWNNSGSANPATGTGGGDCSFSADIGHALWMQSTISGSSATVRTELAEFTQSVPSGFKSWMGETPPAGGVTVSVTGQAVAVSVGGVTVAAKQNVTATVAGQSAAVSAGSVTVDTPAAGVNVTVDVTGQAVAASVGTVTVVGKASTTVTGQAVAVSAGTVSVAGKANAATTGQEAATSVGAVSVTGKASTTITGQSVAVSVSPVTVVGKANISVIGQSATVSVGSVTVDARQAITVPVTGQSVAVSVGTVTVATAAMAGVGVWNGSAWVDKPVKVWTGSVWAQKPVKTWNGSAWV